MPNELAHSTSPYLLQHADNPVDWREWGPGALAEARERDVPILLSVGYAACHWCHVMAHESFEDDDVARVVNEHFVAIKVDREERPDIDAIYMAATTALTGQGGWPMTCFLTPSGEPFHAGTYYPRTQFLQLLAGVADVWSDRRGDVLESGTRIAEAFASLRPAPPTPVDVDLLAQAAHLLGQTFDARRGGFGSAPKFPPAMVVEFLLRHHARTGDAAALAMVESTCTAMALGGIYDQLAGGFARYSVDAAWVVPHFEKMLYDNALLLRVYLSWYRATGSTLARRVVAETAQFLLTDLRTDEGGFASSLDADTDGIEGLTYVWTPHQLLEALGPTDGRLAARTFTVTEAGTFEHGASTLQLAPDADEDARARLRGALLEARSRRPQPGRDDKVVTSWNGLAIAALADAGSLLGEPTWTQAARECADVLLSTHLRGDRLVRASRNGAVGRAAGVADDYGNLAEGLLALYQATSEERWLEAAGGLLQTALTHFADGEGGFYDTADDAEALFTRPRGQGDNAEPSGTSALAGALLTYSALTGEHRDAADSAIASAAEVGRRDPRFGGWALAVAEAAVAGPVQVAVVGDGDDARELAAVARASTSPGRVVVVGRPDAVGQPLLAGRPLVGGRATAYVCHGFVCDLPRTDADAVAAALHVVR